MKKSTLITTIAMIVVVVVALSTATYAWFTSSAVSTASVSLSTTASADFSLTVVNNVLANTSWTQGSTGVGIEMTPHIGLYAPTTAISAAVAFTESDIAASGAQQDFYVANYKTNTTATQADDEASWGVDAIRLVNITASEKDVYMYIVIAVDGDAASTNNIYAAQATSAYVNVADGTSSNVYTTGYGIGTAAYKKAEGAYSNEKTYYTMNASGEFAVVASSSADSFGSYYEAVQDGDFGSGAVLTKTIDVAASGFTAVAMGQAYTSKTTRPAYNGTANTLFRSGEKAELGITNGQYVIIYAAKIADDLASQASLTISALTWIDGWRANNAAGNSSYSVTYAFAAGDSNGDNNITLTAYSGS